MANQPLPSRPWRLLLGNTLRPEPMAASPVQQQPQPQPQPPAFNPVFRSKFGKPETLPQQPPEPSPEPIALPRSRFRNVSSVPSNSSQKTTPPSEKIKPTFEPTEQKTSLIQNPKPSIGVLPKDAVDIEKPGVILPDEKKRGEAKNHKGNHKEADTKDCGLLIITVAGDNKGPRTELSAASMTLETPLAFVNAFINSNVQTISNSIILDSTVTDHDPGVHVFIPRVCGRGDGKDK